jgi:hypothetical protein
VYMTVYTPGCEIPFHRVILCKISVYRNCRHGEPRRSSACRPASCCRVRWRGACSRHRPITTTDWSSLRQDRSICAEGDRMPVLQAHRPVPAWGSAIGIGGLQFDDWAMLMHQPPIPPIPLPIFPITGFDSADTRQQTAGQTSAGITLWKGF